MMLNRLSTYLFKPSLIIVTLIALGLPLNSLWKAAAFFIFCVFLWHGSIKLSTTKKHLFFLSAILLIVIKLFIPKLAIQEGSNIYLPTSQASYLKYTDLPTPVKNYLHASFMQTYPKSSWCGLGQGGCWRNVEKHTEKPRQVKQTYSTSADGFWQNPLYSRIVSNINFHNLQTLRAGFTNRLNTAFFWYGHKNIQRRTMPYFVMYQIPSKLVGSKICWRGTIFWPTGTKTYNRLNSENQTCKTITIANVGNKFYGIRVNPAQPLTIKLVKTLPLNLLQALYILLSILPLLLLLCLFDYKNKFMLSESLMIILLSTLFLIGWQHVMQRTYSFVFSGGNDGLTYRAFGLQALDSLRQGDFTKMFQGGVNVFDTMPGMRYFQLVSAIFFGQTSLGFLSLFFAAYLITYRLFRQFYPTAIAAALFFILTLIMKHSLIRSIHGYADPVGIALVFSGTAALISNGLGLYQRPVKLAYTWLSFLLFGVSVFLRPNFLIGIIIVSLFTFFYLLLKKRVSIFRLILAFTGLIFCILPLLHNLYYGHQFVLFVSSVNIPDNLTMTPLVYWQAFLHFFTNTHEAAYLQTIHKLFNWFNFRHPAEGILSVISFISLFVILSLPKKALNELTQSESNSIAIRLMAWMSLGFQFPLIFWTATSRHAWLAWAFTTFCAIYIGYCLLRKRHQKRSRAKD